MRTNPTIDDVIADAIRRAIDVHTSPLPEYAKGDAAFNARFRSGPAPEGWHRDPAALTRKGSYCTYANRTSIIPLAPGYRMLTYWSPAVYFLPDDTSLPPERVYDGNPIDRNVRPVPIAEKLSREEVQMQVFGHCVPAWAALQHYYDVHGARVEVLRLREIDRCNETGEPFEWLEYPELNPQEMN